MKKIIISLLTVLAFSWASGVAADQSPESIVTCANAGTYLVLGVTLPDTINADHCGTWVSDTQPPDPCAPCIISLENQGCKVIDSVVDTIPEFTVVTYLLSCVKP
jgi:hypothetical protein